MCKLSCTIEFENDTQSYRPGEIIKGLLVLDVRNTILLKGA